MKTAHQLPTKKIVFVGTFLALVLTTIISTHSTALAQTSEIELQNSPQEEVALTAIPPRLGDDGSISAKPGEKLQVQVRVKNISKSPIKITTSSHDFILSEDGQTPIAITDSVSNRWSLSNWLTVTPTQTIINSNQTVGMNVLIEVPNDALPGGHYAMIVHEPDYSTSSDQSTQKNDSASVVSQRVGSLLYLVVEGPINEEAYIRDFTLPEFSEYGPVPFSFTVENNSDIHITPQMSIEIFNLFNQKVDEIAIESKNIFPLTAREFSGQWERIWGFGMYKAKLTMSFGSQGALVLAHKTFWLLPVRILLAIITLLVTVILLALAIKKHIAHRKSIESKRIEELEQELQNIKNNRNQD